MGISLNPRQNKLIALSALLALCVAGCAVLYACRVLVSGRPYYLYLVQNILLAFVPYLIAMAATLLLPRLPAGRGRILLVLPISVLWLLFYPNAPYIFTDFIHIINKVYLRRPPEGLDLSALVWYDLMMNAAFAFVGHFIGLVSMWLMQSFIRASWGKAVSRLFVGLASLLAGFGIYLGRFSRLNSWDAIISPYRVAGEAIQGFSDPLAGLFSFGFALFIIVSYGALASFKNMGPPEPREL